MYPNNTANAAKTQPRSPISIKAVVSVIREAAPAPVQSSGESGLYAADLRIETPDSLGRLAVALKLDQPFRLWLLLWAISRATGGSGIISLELSRYALALGLSEDRTYKMLLRLEALGLAVRIPGRRLMVSGQGAVTRILVTRAIEAGIPEPLEREHRKIIVPDELFATLQGFRAALFAGWFTARPRQMRWSKLSQWWGVSRRAMFDWGQRAGIKKQQPKYHHPNEAVSAGRFDNGEDGYFESNYRGLAFYGGNRFRGRMERGARGKANRLNGIKSACGRIVCAQGVSHVTDTLGTAPTGNGGRLAAQHVRVEAHEVQRVAAALFQPGRHVRTHYSRRGNPKANRRLFKRIRRLQREYPYLDFYIESESKVRSRKGRTQSLVHFDIVGRPEASQM